MTRTVRYRGKSDVRTITDAQYTSLGLTSATTTWQKSNGYELDVNDSVAAYLLAQSDFESGNPNLVFADLVDKDVVGYNLESGLSSWLAAMSGGGRKHVCILGDSNVSFDSALTTWADQLPAKLQTLTGLASGGPGFRHLDLVEWARTGVWSKYNLNDANDLAPNGALYWSTNATDIMTWTPPGGLAAHDRFVLYGMDDDLLQIQGSYSTNGAAFTAAAFSFAGSGPKLVSQEIVTPITTTLRVRGNGGGLFGTNYAGAAFYNGTAGLIVHNLAMGGANIDYFAGINTSNRMALVESLAPKLTICWTLTNELHHNGTSIIQMDLDHFRDSLDKVATKAKLSGDFLFICSQESQYPNGITPDFEAMPHKPIEFERAAKDVCLDHDAGLISIRQAWGDYSKISARGRNQDSWHVNQAGQDALVKLLDKLITRHS